LLIILSISYYPLHFSSKYDVAVKMNRNKKRAGAPLTGASARLYY
jgi:hypothetical protein